MSWDLGCVNQSERRDVPPFSLKAAPPGTYSVKWEITAEGLVRPLEGELSVVVEPPIQADPISTLNDVEEERRARELAFGKPNRPRAAP